MVEEEVINEVEVILGNSNPRFSGVTSTMLQTLTVQQSLIKVKVLGKHHLPQPDLAIGFLQLVTMCKTPLKNGKFRVFHARRNDEMIQALILKYIFRAKIKILFTSTAQRRHSRFTRFLMRKMDKVISTCTNAANYLDPVPDVIIPHGIQLDRFLPTFDKTSEWQKQQFGGKHGIGIFGRVRPQKGVHLFVNACIEVLPKYPDINAIIVGAISEDNSQFVSDLKKRITQAGLTDRIIFTGELEFERLPSLFRSVEVCCALSENEGFGLTPLEAMASGTAVLTTTAGAWQDIVRNGIDGYINPINDQKQITHHLDAMLSDIQATRIMGKNGYQRAQNEYSVEREAKQLIEVYRSLM